MATPTLETSGYEYPRPFQPQGKLQWQKQSKFPLAKAKKRVISKSKGKKPIVKRGK